MASPALLLFGKALWSVRSTWSCLQSEEPGWGGCASLLVCFECRFLVVRREKEGAQPLEVARGSLLRGVNAAESWADVCVQVPLPHKDKSRVS